MKTLITFAVLLGCGFWAGSNTWKVLPNDTGVTVVRASGFPVSECSHHSLGPVRYIGCD